MAANKTMATGRSVDAFLSEVVPEERRIDACALDQLFRRVTGFHARLWGPSIIGYGRYRYRYESGREGDAPATGFSPRKSELVFYILAEAGGSHTSLASLGKHRTGKSCVYVKRLADIDLRVLEVLIGAGLADVATRWIIHLE